MSRRLNYQQLERRELLAGDMVDTAAMFGLTTGTGVDFGDAPESYGTTLAGGGPSHTSPHSGSILLGQVVDTEPDGSPSIAANLDDAIPSIGLDVSTAPTISTLNLGNRTSLTINAVPSVGDQLSLTLGDDPATMPTVFEFSNADHTPDLASILVDVTAESTVDEVTASLHAAIGTFLSAQSGSVGLVASAADNVITLESFDDEDGVAIGTINRLGRNFFVFGVPGSDGVVAESDVDAILVTGQSSTISVDVTGTGFLDAWIDFGGDGVFDPTDRIATALPVSSGSNLVTIDTPAGLTAPFDTYARFRVSETGNLAPGGNVEGGEVEDYRISIAAQNFGLPMNTAPTFDTANLNQSIGESDSAELQTVPGFLTNLVPGNPNRTVENQSQSIASIQVSNVVSTPGLLVPDSLSFVIPAIGDGMSADLQLATTPDLIGQIAFDVVVTDSEGLASAPSRITLTVQPVNDPPSFVDPLGFPATAQRTPDDAYSVARISEDGVIVNSDISYTLVEDNTVALGLQGDPFFIPLNRGNAVGFNRVGLLDVFQAGPSNELASGTPGGNQSVSFVQAGIDPIEGTTARRTALGGSLELVRDVNDDVIGLHYTPPADLNRDFGINDSFVYTVTDDGNSFVPGQGIVALPQTSTNTVNLILNPVNDRPEFTASTQQITVLEDAGLVRIEDYASGVAAGPLETAFDETTFATMQELEFTLVSLDFPFVDSASFFTVFPEIVIDGTSGTLQFQAAPNVFGDFSFEVTLNDNGLENSTRGDLISSFATTLNISVSPVNDAPVLNPDSGSLQFSLVEDDSVEVLIQGDGNATGLLDAFTPGPTNGPADETADLPGGNQSVSLRLPISNVSSQGGTVQLDDSGATPRLVYLPPPNFVGIDTFTYSVEDNGQSSDTNGVFRSDPQSSSNTVTFLVTPQNDAPIFSGAGDVTSTETDAPQTVTIPAWAANVQAGPTTATDEITTTADNTAQTLTFNFTQIEGDASLFAVAPTAIIDPVTRLATLTYQTTPFANGQAVFEVVLEDNGPRDSANGDQFQSTPVRTFTIDVQSVNNSPTFRLLSNIVEVNEDAGPVSVPIVDSILGGPAGALDEADQTVLFTVDPLQTPFAELFSVQPTIGTDGVLRFTLAANANTVASGPVPIRAVAVDSGGTELGGSNSQIFLFQIDVTNQADSPLAVSDSFVTDEDTVLRLNISDLTGNDTDPDPAELLSVNLPPSFTSSSGASIQFDAATGVITYDPTNRLVSPILQALTNDGTTAQTLLDTFTYSVVDATGLQSNTVTVGVTVSGINDAPILVADSPSLNPDGATVIDPLANDLDIDGTIDPASIQISSLPGSGLVEVLPDGRLVYTPFDGFVGEDFLEYTVADNLGLRSAPQRITLSANASPTAVADFAITFVDESVLIDVATNDLDADGQINPAGVVISTPPSRGQAVPQGDGTVLYLPNAGFVGVDRFQYQVTDDDGRISNTATVTVQVASSRLQNPNRFSDVNADGFVTPIDALLIINLLGREGLAEIPVIVDDQGPEFYDVNGDSLITAADALAVLNNLAILNNSTVASGEEVLAPLASSLVSAEDRSRTSLVDEAIAGLF